MKICLFTDSFLPYMSGVSNAVVNQARCLAARGHEILIFCPQTKYRPDISGVIPGKVRLETLKFSVPAPKYDGLSIAVPTILRTAKKIREFNPDIIHAHTEFGAGWEALICSKLLKIPIVGTFHTFFADPEYLKSINAPDGEFLQRFVWRYSVTYLNQCKRVISPSKSTLRALKSHGLKRRSHVVSNGMVLPTLISKEKIVELRKKYGVDKTFNLIYIGRISSEKSLDIALQAFRILLLEHEGSRFIIIGSGPYYDRLANLVRQYGLKDKVILTGRIDNKEVIQSNLLRIGDVFLTASKTENQPLSVMEAMAFKLPVVGVNEKGMPDLVKHGVNGFLSVADDPVEMAGYLIKLCNDEGLREQMAQITYEEISKHNLDKTCDALEKVYTDTINEKKDRKPIANLKRNALGKIKGINMRLRELRQR